MPAVAVCSHLFVNLGQAERRALGMPELPMAITQHPIGGIHNEAVLEKADELLEQIITGLTRR